MTEPNYNDKPISYRLSSSYGTYGWCGVMKHKIPYKNILAEKGTPGILTCITIKMTKEFSDKLDNIEAYREDGFCVNYLTENMKGATEVNLVFHHARQNDPHYVQVKNVKLIFGYRPKRVITAPEFIEKDGIIIKNPIYITQSMRRVNLEPVYTANIDIPDITENLNSGTDICSLCLEYLNTLNESYISKCSHTFHMKCILEKFPVHEKCDRYCSHGKIVLPFKCPTCLTSLEKPKTD